MPVPIYECFAVAWTWLTLPHHCTVDHQRPLATRNATHDDAQVTTLWLSAYAGYNAMAVPTVSKGAHPSNQAGFSPTFLDEPELSQRLC